MATQTIYVYEASSVSITNSAGSTYTGVIESGLWGDSFSWQTPNDLSLDLPSSTVAITYDDSDGLLQDDPYSGSNATDQFLSASTTLNGTQYNPSSGQVRWDNPAPVTVESEYVVTVYDADGNTYNLVGISITQGYSSQVVGIMFDGAQPPPGTALSYIQGTSTYTNTGTAVDPNQTVPCFVAGTRIDTPDGPRRIESLKVGDLVTTLDQGARPILWIGRSNVDGRGPLAPVLIPQGALGNTGPLKLSPNHRILLQSPQAELLFCQHAVLVPAKALVDGRTIVFDPAPRVTYIHLLLNGHELIFAEGIATESLFTGAMALSALDAAARAELAAILPQHDQEPHHLNRPDLNATEARLLMACFKVNTCITAVTQSMSAL